MLVLTRKIHYLRHFGFRYFVRIDAADADAAAVHMQHDAGRFLPALAEKTLEGMHHELHRRVVVIQHQDLVHGRLFRLRLGLDDDTRARSFLAASSVIAHLVPRRSPPRMILALPVAGKALSSHGRPRPSERRLIRRGEGGSTA